MVLDCVELNGKEISNGQSDASSVVTLNLVCIRSVNVFIVGLCWERGHLARIERVSANRLIHFG